jgi:HEAT repeats
MTSALGEIRIDPKLSAPALVKALSDPDVNVRLHSAVALGKISSPAITLMIERLAAHPDDYIAFGLSQCGVDIVEPLLAAVRKQRLRGPQSGHVPSKHGPELISRFEDYAWALFANIGNPGLPALIGALNDTALDSFVVQVLESIYPVISVRGYLSPSEAASAFARAVVERCKADPAAY